MTEISSIGMTESGKIRLPISFDSELNRIIEVALCTFGRYYGSEPEKGAEDLLRLRAR